MIDLEGIWIAKVENPLISCKKFGFSEGSIVNEPILLVHIIDIILIVELSFFEGIEGIILGIFFRVSLTDPIGFILFINFLVIHFVVDFLAFLKGIVEILERRWFDEVWEF